MMEVKNWNKNRIRIIAFNDTFTKVCISNVDKKIGLLYGEIEENETPEQATVRILKEKTGLDIKAVISTLHNAKNEYGDNVTTVVISTVGNLKNKNKELMMISKRQTIMLLEQEKIKDDAQLFLYMWYIKDLLN